MLGFDLQSLAALYEVNLEDLVAARAAIEVDLQGRTISAGSVHTDLESEELDAVLSRYLAVVRELRSTSGDENLPLRDDDVQTLADVLELDEGDIAHRLGVLMGCSDEEAARAWSIVRNRVVVRSAMGLLIGALAVAGVSSLPAADASTGSGGSEATPSTTTTSPTTAEASSTSTTTPVADPTADLDRPVPTPDPAPPTSAPTIEPDPESTVAGGEIPTEIGTAMTVEKQPDGSIVTEEG